MAFFSKIVNKTLISQIRLYPNLISQICSVMLKRTHCTKKRTFPLRISSANVIKSVGNADLVTFTEERLNGRLHFLCSDLTSKSKSSLFSSNQPNFRKSVYIK